MSKESNRKMPEDEPPVEGEMSESEIDRSLMESFPASDPPPWTLGTSHRLESPDSADEETEDDLTR